MKVVLFCGGLGMRLRPLTPGGAGDDLPKPMVQVGEQRPLLWHVMKYYAHFGHKDFILCLGYKAEVIKNFFLNYNECLTNDFVFEQGGAKLSLLRNDIQEWRITFVDTGLNANVGQRLCAVKPYLEGEEVFFANYSDGVSDLPLPEYYDAFMASRKVGAFVCIRPPHTTHVVDVDEDGTVVGITHIRKAGVRINGGYFIFRKEIFDFLHEGEELVEAPFERLIAERKLFGYKYDGFWTCIDTFKEKEALDALYASGTSPWQVWMRKAPVPEEPIFPPSPIVQTILK